MISITLAPFLPMSLFWLLVVVSAIVSVLWLYIQGPKAFWRVLAMTCLILALLNPSLTREDSEKAQSVIAVIIDKSSSQTLVDRMATTNAAHEAISRTLQARTDIEPRFVEVKDGANDGGTMLFSALATALSDVPRSRIAGAIMITDGVVHDIPETKEKLDLPGPLHVLITGKANERDRQVRFLTAPKFGIVGKELEIKAVVEEHGGMGNAEVMVRGNGKELQKVNVTSGVPFTIKAPVEHGGSNVIELEVEPLEGELTTLNNKSILTIEGIRDKLRVLLVSGQPHPGERAWRNLLKSDPNVELVHFTILRSADKVSGIPINELSLISFPIHDLFVNRLHDFDLVIFDRYSNQGYIPVSYFNNIAEYLTQGGALLVVAGPEYINQTSLAYTLLSQHLPAVPTGNIIEQRFRPAITTIGERHPVTREWSGSVKPSEWGEWFRIIEAKAPVENTLMSGARDMPLLVLGNAGRGRVATLLSDQIWLWARGFNNGGPYIDFQRRLVHWLMKEPSLEQEALRAQSSGNNMSIVRQTMMDDPGPVILQMPDGTTRDILLKQQKPGIFTAEVTSDQNGLHSLKSGGLISFVSIGPASPREFINVFSSPEHIRPLAEATGGSVRRVTDTNLSLPRIDTGMTGSRYHGANWIGFPQGNAVVSRSISQFPTTTGFPALFLLIGLALAAWLVEGRNKTRSSSGRGA